MERVFILATSTERLHARLDDTISRVKRTSERRKDKGVLEWLRDVYRHQARNGTDSKRDPTRKLLSWTCGGLNELLEGSIGREADSRISALSHHLGRDAGYVEQRWTWCTYDGEETSVYARDTFFAYDGRGAMQETAVAWIRTLGIVDELRSSTWMLAGRNNRTGIHTLSFQKG